MFTREDGPPEMERFSGRCVQEHKKGEPVLQITPSERLALQLLAQDKAPSEIANCLGVNASDVGPSLTALFAKMGASCQIEAIASALRRGLLVADGEDNQKVFRG